MTQLLAKRRAQILAGKVRRPRTDQKGKVRLPGKNKFSGDIFVLAEPKRQPRKPEDLEINPPNIKL